MPSEMHDLIARVKAVEREHAALRFMTDHALRSLESGAVGLAENLKRSDIGRASERLEGTYLIRLFSEFEDVLKTILRERRKKVPRDAKPLIDRVASHARFAGAIFDNAHLVREHRNQLVHHWTHGAPSEDQITIRAATSHLCTFLSRAAARW